MTFQKYLISVSAISVKVRIRHHISSIDRQYIDGFVHVASVGTVFHSMAMDSETMSVNCVCELVEYLGYHVEKDFHVPGCGTSKVCLHCLLDVL